MKPDVTIMTWHHEKLGIASNIDSNIKSNELPRMKERQKANQDCFIITTYSVGNTLGIVLNPNALVVVFSLD